MRLRLIRAAVTHLYINCAFILGRSIQETNVRFRRHQSISLPALEHFCLKHWPETHSYPFTALRPISFHLCPTKDHDCWRFDITALRDVDIPTYTSRNQPVIDLLQETLPALRILSIDMRTDQLASLIEDAASLSLETLRLRNYQGFHEIFESMDSLRFESLTALVIDVPNRRAALNTLEDLVLLLDVTEDDEEDEEIGDFTTLPALRTIRFNIADFGFFDDFDRQDAAEQSRQFGNESDSDEYDSEIELLDAFDLDWRYAPYARVPREYWDDELSLHRAGLVAAGRCVQIKVYRSALRTLV